MLAVEAPASSPPLEPETDDALVARIRAGDQTAFQLLYDRYFRRVYHFLDKRLRNRADTEETTQEVFINLFSSIHSWRGDAPFAAWVFGITRRTLASRFKKKRHVTVSLTETEGEDGEWSVPSQDVSADPLAAYEYRERVRHLQEAMDRNLTAEQRKLFQLHHVQNRSIQEIAAVLHKTEDAIKSNLYRARKLLLAR